VSAAHRKGQPWTCVWCQEPNYGFVRRNDPAEATTADLVSDTQAGLPDAGEVSGYTKLLTDSRNQARARMWAQARARGANAVVAMRFDCYGWTWFINGQLIAENGTMPPGFETALSHENGQDVTEPLRANRNSREPTMSRCEERADLAVCPGRTVCGHVRDPWTHNLLLASSREAAGKTCSIVPSHAGTVIAQVQQSA
jgi:uncharacterized protein YbjQ (UPF0145 family)